MLLSSLFYILSTSRRNHSTSSSSHPLICGDCASDDRSHSPETRQRPGHWPGPSTRHVFCYLLLFLLFFLPRRTSPAQRGKRPAQCPVLLDGSPTHTLDRTVRPTGIVCPAKRPELTWQPSSARNMEAD